MKFRPCIDIHNGKVKQIVGGSLKDLGDYARENFVSSQDAAWYAGLYKDMGLDGGHVILLNGADSSYYEETKAQAISALSAFKGGLMIGGGINPGNAMEYLDAGASHVIVTSYVFKDGRIHYDRIDEMLAAVGKDRLVLDLSCRKKLTENGEKYYVVTDRWQKFTDEELTEELLEKLSGLCDEFLIHAVDVEGKGSGADNELIKLLSAKNLPPVTYAGGVGSLKDLKNVKKYGKGRVDVTIGSALKLFGGSLELSDVLALCR